jgi:hypothetical protein
MPCQTTCVQPSPSQAHCAVCHLTWSGVSGFDRHRRNGRCLAPPEIGYADDGRGVFRAPPTEAGRKRFEAIRAAHTDAPSACVREPQTDETPSAVGADTSRPIPPL